MADYEKAANSYQIRLQRKDSLSATQKQEYLTATKIYVALESKNQDLYNIGKDMSEARKWFESTQDRYNTKLKDKSITKDEYNQVKKKTEQRYAAMLNGFLKRQSDIYDEGLKIIKKFEEKNK